MTVLRAEAWGAARPVHHPKEPSDPSVSEVGLIQVRAYNRWYDMLMQDMTARLAIMERCLVGPPAMTGPVAS